MGTVNELKIETLKMVAIQQSKQCCVLSVLVSSVIRSVNLEALIPKNTYKHR